MTRPYIVCHMLTSINGKISGPYIGSQVAEIGNQIYERANDDYQSQAWLCGRVTMEENFTHYLKPDLTERDQKFPREDFIAEKNAEMYIISADPSGKVGWDKNFVDYAERPRAHIIEILTDKASDMYISFLRAKNISYIFAGKSMIDCKTAAEKLFEQFHIRTLMVSGGGFINWSFLQEGLVDEISIVMTPVTDGRTSTHTIFERSIDLPDIDPIIFKLKSVEIIEKDILWIRYVNKSSLIT